MRVRTVLLVMLSGGCLLLAACDSGGGKGARPSLTLAETTSSSTAVESMVSRPSDDTTSAPLTPLPRVFDPHVMRDSVLRILTDSYGIEGVESVTCPPDQPVEVGLTFECTAVVDGDTQPVPITVKNEDGEYEVGYPG
ncbi:hypothetical protein SacmaDRAFT_2848 [Saccharomonospora marina XMU15]|uniref:DUF4333 domain-containing protein n=1 Tax=Saccharomonospora marina XMU15 TaxID=882083 RepID=H5X4L1_9PSEU|nr:DUF4333 domain-containing protein [Saccharomonospora marina]EHR51087.1 hypothetical protein SacmaDRAFT_2848 [Saccharomonospora marina XMU15]